MKNVLKKIRDARLRKLPVLIALAASLVVPAAIRAYAEPGLTVANINEDGVLETEAPQAVEDTTTETPVTEEETPVDPTDETETEVIEEPETPVTEEEEEADEIPAPVDPVTSVETFMSFANAEHPGVEVESYAFIYKHGIKSFKVTYVDGYTVYLATGDFSTLKVIDSKRRVKKCQKRVMSHRRYYHWWKKFNSYQDFWRHYQQNADEATDGIDPNEDEEQSESDAEVSARVRGEARVRGDNDRRDERSTNWNRSSKKHHNRRSW